MKIKSTINVLLIENKLNICDIIQTIFSQSQEINFRLQTVRNLQEAKEKLNNQEQYHLLLLELSGESQQVDTVNQLKAIAPETPIIIITYLKDQNVPLDVICQGGDDCLLKDELNSTILIDSIKKTLARNEKLAANQLLLKREIFLYKIVEKIRYSVKLEEILQNTVKEIKKFLKVDEVFICKHWTSNKGKIMIFSENYLVEIANKVKFTYVRDYLEEFNSKINIDIKGKPNITKETPQTEKKILTLPINNYQDEDQQEWGKLVAIDLTSTRIWEEWEIKFLKKLLDKVSGLISQAELYQKIQQLATTDELTSLANRRQFKTILKQEWQRAIREQKPLALILCDIDFFKSYNDAYGHLLGDEALKKIAQALKQTVQRCSDVAARYGGEEFVLILPNTDLAGASVVAERIRLEIENLKIPHKKSRISKYITISLGIATMIPQLTLDYSYLLESADKALYQAKLQGRNQSCPEVH